MNKQVIYKFNDEAHLNACLEWWQMRLGLRDWIIKAKLTNDLNDDDNHGENEYQPSNKCAMIRKLIEDMAKALIMAKYGLTLEWFKV